MKPLIGIITRPDYLESGRKVDVIYSSIRTSIIEHGGIPIGITPSTDTLYQNNDKELNSAQWNDLKSLVNLCDGLVFQGGDSFYDYDLKIVDYAYKHNIPSLGICLGMQLMAFSRNGDIKRIPKRCDNHYSLEQYVHKVILKENCLLNKILDTNEINVNSRHHDHIVKTDLDVVGWSNDQVIEAVEAGDKRFFIGVQWHPEDMVQYDEVMNKLWSYFVSACKECHNENK